MSKLSNLRRVRPELWPDTGITDFLLQMQDLFAQIEEGYAEYLEDESIEPVQYKIQERIADLGLAAQNVLLILESENADWMPSPSLDSAMMTRLQDLQVEQQQPTKV